MTYFKKLTKSRGFTSFMASLASIVVGLIVGMIVLLFFDASHAFSGMGKIIVTGLSGLPKLAKVLYQAAPLIMTGLSVGFAFKTGLFNIGASGQYTLGAFFAIVCAMVFKLPWYVSLLASMIGGAIWGAIPGVCKAFFNVNEVITSIMFNWIGLFGVNLAFSNMTGYLDVGNRTLPITSAYIIPKLGLDKLFKSPYMNFSIFIAVICAVIIWIVLTKTTFGYELRACGYNRSASVYAGINAKRNIVLSMLIAGALSGIAGGIFYLHGASQYTIEKAILTMGYNGIPVALLATSHPLGTIFSALFISYIQVGGEAMQPVFVTEIIDIIVAVIIYLAAFALLMRGIIGRFIKADGGNVNAEPEQGAPGIAQENPAKEGNAQ
ncbi:MAG TPA: ABC transporter permease [Clostridia bacterium]|nr:ABC transporter permease [Clostridia bacterium]